MEEIWFLVNPRAGATGHKIKKIISKSLVNLQKKYPFLKNKIFSILSISGHSETRDIIKSAISRKISRIVICGGDGTIHSILPYVVGKPITLGIVPTGSGNGTVAMLGIPKQVKRAIYIALTGKTAKVDVLKCNEEYFINVGGCGVDARVAHVFNKGGRRGMLPYFWHTFLQLIRRKSFSVEMEVDGTYYKFNNIIVLAVCNGHQYGSGFKIAPPSPFNDGMFSLTLIENKNLIMGLPDIIRFFTGDIDKIKGLHILNARECIIHSGTHIWHLDGEPRVMRFPIRISVIPRALNISVPENTKM